MSLRPSGTAARIVLLLLGLVWMAAIVWVAVLAHVRNPDGVAVIIGNSTYRHEVPPVSFAHRDATAFKRYLIDVVGFHRDNIIELHDASQADMESALGSERSHEGNLWSYLDPEGNSDVVVFYSGHSVSGLNDKRGYLLPTDAHPATAEIHGYPIDLLFQNLAKLEKARSIAVYLDTSFSGDDDVQEPAGSRPPLVRPPLPAAGRMTALIAVSSAGEIALREEATQHGLFTRHLLEALYGAADADGNNRITAGEVAAYLMRYMTGAARRLYQHYQMARLIGPPEMVLGSVVSGRFPPRPELPDALPITPPERGSQPASDTPDRSPPFIRVVAVINPNTQRILKAGFLHRSSLRYYSIADGEHADRCHISEPQCWTGVGARGDYLGPLLEERGFHVAYYAADEMPAVGPNEFDLVIIQDPMTTNRQAYDKATVERTTPDLLEHVLSSQFQQNLAQYHRAGGAVILVGDAVHLLQGDANGLGADTSIRRFSVANTPSQPDLQLPARWMFVRGNPFCGLDRSGAASYTATNDQLVPAGSVIGELRLFDGHDLPNALVWSDTFYTPADGTSLLDVRITGRGDYVLRGDICRPPEYEVAVDAVSSLIGYTVRHDRKVFYLASDSFFDYRFRTYAGAWHAREYRQIQFHVTDAGRAAIAALVELALEKSSVAAP